MRSRWSLAWPAGITVLALLMLAATAVAQENRFSLHWWTVDGGGGAMQSNGYVLQATIGQPDAGRLAGGSYRLSGGFWPESRPVGRVYLPFLNWVEWP